MAYTDTVNRYADQVLDVVRKVNGTAVNAASAVTERIGRVLPEELPGAEAVRNLPKPEEFVKIYFDFLERFVKTQRTYALDMAKAFQPITGKIWHEAKVRKSAA